MFNKSILLKLCFLRILLIFVKVSVDILGVCKLGMGRIGLGIEVNFLFF